MKAELNTTYPSHDRTEQKEQTFPMPGDIGFWKLDANSKYTDSEDDTGKLESDGIRNLFIAISPTARIKYSSPIRSWIES